MEELLAGSAGKEVDLVIASGVTLRGKVRSVSGGVAVIEDEDGKTFHVCRTCRGIWRVDTYEQPARLYCLNVPAK